MKILLAVDGSPSSDAVVREVMARPWPTGSELRALHVLQIPNSLAFAYAPPPALALGPAAPMWPASLMEMEKVMATKSQQLLAAVAERLGASGLEVSTALRRGDPRSEIVGEAHDWPADLIMLGSRGHGALERLLLGSVAHSVVTHAPCAVEVVRER